MTRDEFLKRARELRAEADAAESRFLEFLYEAEKQRDLWADTGLSFAELVERENLCKAARYLAYKRVRDNHGADVVGSVGAHAVVAAGALKEPDAQREVIKRAEKWEKANGTAISEQSAKNIAKEERTRAATVQSGGRSYSSVVEENERLRDENKALRERNALLQTENKALKAEIESLKAGTTDSTAPKATTARRRKAA